VARRPAARRRRRGSTGRTSDLTGKAKEKTGEITGDDDLKREGQADQAVAKVKDGVDKIADKAKNLVNKEKKT